MNFGHDIPVHQGEQLQFGNTHNKHNKGVIVYLIVYSKYLANSFHPWLNTSGVYGELR